MCCCPITFWSFGRSWGLAKETKSRTKKSFCREQARKDVANSTQASRPMPENHVQPVKHTGCHRDPTAHVHGDSTKFCDQASIINMVGHIQSTGKEDANMHMQKFQEICSSFKIHHASHQGSSPRMPLSLLLSWEGSSAIPYTGDSNHRILDDTHGSAFVNNFFPPCKTQALQ